jgi:hypothetical protein
MQWCNGAVRAVVKCSSAWYSMLCSSAMQCRGALMLWRGVVQFCAVLCSVMQWSSAVNSVDAVVWCCTVRCCAIMPFMRW